jgi:hypothetical protein
LKWAIGNTDESTNIWLVEGMAGTGKSTLARSIAEDVNDAGHVVMSFFFDRDVEDRKDVKKLAATLARQLADVSTALKSRISDALKKDRDISNRDPGKQWETLIKGPLESLKTVREYTDSRLQPENFRPIVFLVVDALDECSAQDIQILGSALESMQSIGSVSFRVLITSRFRHIQVPLANLRIKKCQLDERSVDKVERDLEILYITELQSIWKNHLKERKLLDGCEESDTNEAAWPTQEDIQRLVFRADRLFQYAVVACRLIRGSIESPTKQLQDILATPPNGLDGIYTTALQNTIPSYEQPEFSKRFELMFGALLLSPDPISIISLQELVFGQTLSLAEVRSFLARFYSVLHMPSKKELAIRVIHLSFRDFMLENERNKDSHFQIDQPKIHRHLFQRSFDIMESTQGLKRNKADLKSPGTCIVEVKTGVSHDADEEDEIVRRDSLNIKPELQYACRYWVHHLEQSKISINDQDKVYCFFQEHFLHWLEALSLMGKITDGAIMLSALESMLTASNSITLPYC